MDDMDVIRSARPARALVAAHDQNEARETLLAAIASEQQRTRPATPALVTRAARHWPGRRPVAAAAVAAAAAAVVALAVSGNGSHHPARVVPAAFVLGHAASAVAGDPSAPPADRFVYTETRSGDLTRESWLSVDGHRDGLVKTSGARTSSERVPGCDATARSAPNPATDSTCVPAYRADLPTDADEMLTYLRRHHAGQPADVNAVGKDVLDLLNGTYLAPQSRAALFRAAARIPGLRTVPDARDGAGRPGIGITWSANRNPVVLVFDTGTYAYLGTNLEAVLARAVVVSAGDRH